MVLEDPDKAAALEREQACQDLWNIWQWCQGGHHEKQLQKEYRSRKAKSKGDQHRDQKFAMAVESLGLEAFCVMQAIKSGQEQIFSYGQVIARAAQLSFITWSDPLSAGVKTMRSPGRPPVPVEVEVNWRSMAEAKWQLKHREKLDVVAKEIDPGQWRSVREVIRDLNPNRRLSDPK